MAVYNKFSNEYNALFQKNIAEFKREYSQQKSENQYYLSFYPMFGIKPNEKCDILFLGQAVNGWGTGFNSHNNSGDNSLGEIIEFSNNYLKEKSHSPLDLVNMRWSKNIFNSNTSEPLIKEFYDGNSNGVSYFFYRSFFWNVVYKTISDYYGIDRGEWDWSKKLVWSNLYKIAPEDANPNEFEKEIQQSISIELIKKEIEELKPKYCIVLTNSSWWLPFQKGLKTKALPINPELDRIQHNEMFKETQVIVTTRPFRGSNEKHVEQILKLIKP